MAQARKARTIDGFSAEQSAALFREFARRDAAIASLGDRDASSELVTDDFVARANQTIRVQPPETGQAGLLPPPERTVPGDRVTILIEAPSGVLTLSCVSNQGEDGIVRSGTVNGQERASFAFAGAVELVSNGDDNWTTASEHPAESAALSLADVSAELGEPYVVWGAPTYLSAARRTVQSTEVDVELSAANVISWALRDASVVAGRLVSTLPYSVFARSSGTAGQLGELTALSDTVLGRQSSGDLAFGKVILSQMADISPGEVLGLQVDAAGDAEPARLTGLEQGENWRRGTVQTISAAPGDYTAASFGTTLDAIDDTATTIRLTISSDGVVNLHGLPADSGRVFELRRGNSTGILVLRSGSSTEPDTGNRFNLPSNEDLFMKRLHDTVEISYPDNRWFAKWLSPNENELDDSGSSDLTDYARPRDETLIRFNPGAAIVVNSIAAGWDGQLLHFQKQGSGDTIDLIDESSSGTTGAKLGTSDNQDIRMVDDDEIASFVRMFDRWRCFTHRPPFCNVPGNAADDTIVHDGTRWGLKANGNKGRLLQVTEYAAGASGTHSWHSETANVFVQVLGAGGGGGGVDGDGSSWRPAAGGQAGGYREEWGEPGTGNYSVGSGGAGGNGTTPTDGADGGDTFINLNAGNVTALGGKGQATITSGGTTAPDINVAIDIDGAGEHGGHGIVYSVTGNGLAISGRGGSSPFGDGGSDVPGGTTTIQTGEAGNGLGAGGAGAIVASSSNNRSGGAGTGGFLRIWEYT